MAKPPKQKSIKTPSSLQRSEAKIRDLVAANLSGIDPHLQLVKTEHVVRRADGVEARIDILAKDTFGCFTVIEIKKSSQTSRSAVQQLYKYASFLKSTRRLEGHQIRCVIVSTVWEELLAPFSEFKHFSDYESHGYQLNFDSAGLPKYLEIETTFEAGDTSPLSKFIFFEFASKQARDTCLASFIEIVNFLPSLNSLVVPVDYVGDRREIVNPFGFTWSLFSGNTQEVKKELLQRLPEKADLICADDESEAASPTDALYGIQALLLNEFVNLTEGEYADFELHSFTNILSSWKSAQPLGFGPMHAEGFFDTQETLDLAAGLLGDHHYTFAAKTTGARPSHHATVRARLDKFLVPNPNWRSAVNCIFNEIDAEDILSINVFNPLNIFGLFNDLFCHGESKRIPSLTIHRRHGDGRETIYRGQLYWTTTQEKLSARDAVDLSYPNKFSFVMRTVNHQLNMHDEKLSRCYGLTYEVVRQTNGKTSLLQGLGIDTEWRDAPHIRTLQDFVDNHHTLLAEVGEYFDGFMHRTDAPFGINSENGVFSNEIEVENQQSSTSIPPSLVHDAAAHLFWTLATTLGVLGANSSVIETNGRSLLNQPWSQELLEQFGFPSMPMDDRIKAEQLVMAEAKHYATSDLNMDGVVYAEDSNGRSPSAKNLQLDFLEKLPKEVEISGYPLKRGGWLCIRHPLPAVVFIDAIPEEKIIEVADTQGALGFQFRMFLSIVNVQQVTSSLFVLSGVFHIPATKERGELWNMAIQNSTRFVSNAKFILDSESTSIDVLW